MDNIEEKQNFLRKEILDEGFNVDEFVNWLTMKKPENADDIEAWSLYELREVVKEFKSKYPKQTIKIDSIVEKLKGRPSITTTNKQTIIEKVEKVEKVEKELEPNQEYEEIITCKKMDKSPITDIDNIQIVISE
jgi:hypothetical protein